MASIFAAALAGCSGEERCDDCSDGTVSTETDFKPPRYIVEIAGKLPPDKREAYIDEHRYDSLFYSYTVLHDNKYYTFEMTLGQAAELGIPSQRYEQARKEVVRMNEFLENARHAGALTDTFELIDFKKDVRTR